MKDGVNHKWIINKFFHYKMQEMKIKTQAHFWQS